VSVRVPRWRPPTRAQALVLAVACLIAVLGAVVATRLATDLSTTGGPAAAASVATTPRSGLPTVTVAQLPEQARDTLTLIDHGGSFPYRQDGTVFSNLERRLPARPAGYYHEYTVRTPGSPDRGMRRLILGAGGDLYYTDDHYGSFRQVLR
jgi:ribonuclease T1